MWWLIPIIATLLAVVWVTWSGRPRRPADPHQTLAAHRRFTEALANRDPVAPAAHDVTPVDDDLGAAPEQRRSA